MSVTELKTKDNRKYTATDVAYEIKVIVRETELEDALEIVIPFAEFITLNQVEIR